MMLKFHQEQVFDSKNRRAEDLLQFRLWFLLILEEIRRKYKS